MVLFLCRVFIIADSGINANVLSNNKMQEYGGKNNNL
jgi:hypothetical protein